ncbi:MAG TPA: hypothetical protein DIT48_11925 [Actinobacteria bacterium]|nr:hypothetical protein [Actinomycetota bacterium]HCP60985.1 hypothetical protein [Actinomycetota bacterium]
MIAPIWTDVSPQGLVRAVEAHEVAHLRSWGELSGGTVDELPDVLLTRSGTSVPWSNGAIGARFETANADRRIAETLEIIRSRGVPATWRVMPSDRPPDLAARLAAAGLEQQPLAWMALDLETLETHAAAAPPAPPGLRPRRVLTREDQDLWLDVMAKGFVRMTAEAWAFLDRTADATGYGDDASWWRFVGEQDGRIVGSSGIVWTGGVAGIYNVTTPPELRRRGVATAMSQHALRTARAHGHRVAVLGSSDLGRGVYERLGFRDVCTVAEFAIEPQA